jgi:hypothetical protein
MDSNIFQPVYDFTLRGNYPNFHNINFFIRNRDLGLKPKEGYIPPEVEYRVTKNSQTKKLNAEFTDIPYLCQEDNTRAKRYLSILIAATRGNVYAKEKLVFYRKQYLDNKKWSYRNINLIENKYVVHSGTDKDYPTGLISHKGVNLLNMIKKSYPVPDFSILTTEWYSLKKKIKDKHLKIALSNLEQMTGDRLKDSDSPLVIAIRCAMPQYIPGLMPTYLNAGVVQKTLDKLKKLYGIKVAGKIYLDNLITIFSLLYHKKEMPQLKESLYYATTSDIYKQINEYFNLISKKDDKLLKDPFYQIRFLLNSAIDFFENNKDLPYTLIRHKTYPSFILQKMVWTIRDENSYPGVLFSRHSRTGLGYQIESKKNIFGVDIMSGNIQPNDKEYFDRKEIKDSYPEVYHFTPLLRKLEKDYKSPVTIEFAAESFSNTHLFAILQINDSELTGRASLLSAINLYDNKLIDKDRVIKLVQPYHLRQIFSETIEAKSLNELICFSEGISILPRSAVSARIFFSSDKVIEAKKRGEKVCFCKDRFVPADTIIMKEVDAMISMHPAAIHVVTACKGYGIPAFLNLENFGVKLLDDKLQNSQGITIKEGDWITMSSKRKTVFIGKASYEPARFQQFLNGKKIDLNEKEEKVFINLKTAYNKYKAIIDSLDTKDITSINDLVKFIGTDLANNKNKAEIFINEWYDSHEDYYIEQILQSELGTHQDRQRLYKFLSIDKKISFFKKAVSICIKNNLKGYNAGSFMLGRFLNIVHPVSFWKKLTYKEIVFLLNEYILFEKYMFALNFIGERKINKVRSSILTEGLQKININMANAKIFITLKMIIDDWDKPEAELSDKYEPETKELLSLLKIKYGELYDYNSSWSFSKLAEICKNENIPIPDKQDF